MHELLTPSQMKLADRRTIGAICSGIELMENAGDAVLKTFEKQFPNEKRVLVLCGTGNNGGDGFIAAHRLLEKGIEVTVFICGNQDEISGDARLAYERLDHSCILTKAPDFSHFDVIIDALLGAGLSRPVEGYLLQVIENINNSAKPVLSIDLPSGIDGATGQIMGQAVKATCTSTFFRFKPGHVLYPGRAHCGILALDQIGIPEGFIERTGYTALQNSPDWWQLHYPFPSINDHKYSRGHTLVLSGPALSTGAARLAAHAALRSGSGLVTVLSPVDALAINASHLTSIMLKQLDSPAYLSEILLDHRINCVVLGPGMPPDPTTRDMVTTTLENARNTVLDAGALSAFSKKEKTLFAAIKSSSGDVFLTPHSGEFATLFPDEQHDISSKIEQAVRAASKSEAVVVLKGADTVVAAPDGRVSVNTNAPPWLASAGSGDVLTGIIAGLSAQEMPAFEAASAAVWLHGEAANIIGAGMISSDLDEGLKKAILHLACRSSNDQVRS